jgi:hypothetical protein
MIPRLPILVAEAGKQVGVAFFQNAVDAFYEFGSVLDFYVVETAKQSVVLAEPQQTLLIADFFS